MEEIEQGVSKTHGFRHAEFPATRWTLVTLARRPDDPEAVRALEEICECYWYPIYAFIRRCGASPSDAEDTTQNFFSTIHEHVQRADADRGRLRTFFMAIARKKFADHRKFLGAKKRGGGAIVDSLDETSAEGRYLVEPVDPSATPEEFYEYVWAKEITLNCLAAVGREWELKGRGGEFETLRSLVLRPMIEFDLSVTRESACEGLSISAGSLRQRIKAIRDRLWAILANEVSGTLSASEGPNGRPSQQLVAEEVAYLFSALSTTGTGVTSTYSRPPPEVGSQQT